MDKVTRTYREASGKTVNSLLKDIEGKIRDLGRGEPVVEILDDSRNDRTLKSIELKITIKGSLPVWTALYYKNSFLGWHPRATAYYRKGEGS